MVTANDVVRALNDIAQSRASSAELQAQLAQVSLSDLYKWSYSETKSIEYALSEAKRNISRRRASENRRIA